MAPVAPPVPTLMGVFVSRRRPFGDFRDPLMTSGSFRRHEEALLARGALSQREGFFGGGAFMLLGSSLRLPPPPLLGNNVCVPGKRCGSDP